ncbi:MAG: hypothetical protein HYX40_08135 [Sphingobacteriales bacterium]|nr:hypothetical protein [Sphingobacteriales bacterium]
MKYLLDFLLILMMTGTISTVMAQKQVAGKIISSKKVVHIRKRNKGLEKRPVPKVAIKNLKAIYDN